MNVRHGTITMITSVKSAQVFGRCLVCLILLFSTTRSWSQALDSWTVPMTISLDGGQDRVSFGAKAGASDGLDPNLDVLNPPPPPNRFDAFFRIAGLFPNLSEDYRASGAASHDWNLRITGTNGASGVIAWDASGFPVSTPPSILEIRNGSTVLADMLSESSLAFTGDQNLTIHFETPPTELCFTYNFPVATGAWYLVSLPVVPANGSLNALFPQAIAAFDWDYGIQDYVFVSTLVPGRAYWLLFLQAFSAEICGPPFQSYTNNYSVIGWDMVGAVSQTSSLSDNPANSVLAMFGWDPFVQDYFFISPFSFAPQQGYWILVFSAPSSVTIGSGNAASSSPLRQNALLADFHRNHGTMPPRPPFSLDDYRDGQAPQSFSLLQNYPNPFNPETIIEYQLPQAGRVSLKIYDMLGREVRALVEAEMPAGYHRVKWDGTDGLGQKLQSGIYVYQLHIASASTNAGQARSQTKKLILLK